MDSSDMRDGGHWLDKTSAEFDTVLYSLQISLDAIGSASPIDCEVWKVENLDLSYRFDRRTSNMLKVPCWINALNLQSSQRDLQTICSRGFDFDDTDEKGMSFSTGVLDPRDFSLFMNREVVLLFTEVAVGRSYVWDGTQPTAATAIPVGYDSLYLLEQPLDRNNDGQFSLQEYRAAANFDGRSARDYCHRYFVKDPLQVIPKYLVRFKLSKQNKMEKTRPNGFRPRMEEEEVLMDPIYLSPVAKKVAHGSSAGSPQGPATPYLTVDQAFQRAVDDLRQHEKDPLVSGKEEWIGKQLDQLDEKVRSVNLNYAEVSDAITEACDNALRNLQEMTRKKLETLLSLEIELRREQEQLTWIDSLVQSKLQNVLMKTDNYVASVDDYEAKLEFLKFWKNHAQFRNALSRSRPTEVQTLKSIQGDIRVNPDIRFIQDAFYSTSVQPTSDDVSVDSTPSVADRVSNMKRTTAWNPSFARTTIQIDSEHKADSVGLPMSIQHLVDDEMVAIQGAIMSAIESSSVDSSLPLPASISRPALSGERYHVPLHSLLKGLRYSDSEHHITAHVYNSSFFDDTDEDGNTMQLNEESKNIFGVSMTSILGTKDSTVPDEMLNDFEADGPGEISAQFDDEVAESGAGLGAQDITSSPVLETSADVSYGNSFQPKSLMMQTSPASSIQRITVASTSPKGAQSIASSSYNASKSKVEPSITYEKIFMSLAELQYFAALYPHYSLEEYSSRRMKQLKSRHAVTSQQGLSGLLESKILAFEEAQQVYFSLPLFSSPPSCKLLFSTTQHPRKLDELFTRSLQHRGPGLLLIKSGEYKFGVYLSHPIVPTSAWTGSPACFLFSVTLGLRFPYHGRTVTPDENVQYPLALYVDRNHVFVGNGDLVIDDTLTNGSSELENCYGLSGLEPGSKESQCMLAGSALFTIDTLELWAINIF